MTSGQDKVRGSRPSAILGRRLQRVARPGSWLLMLLLFAGIASAQFSGPALPLSTPVNPPMTLTTDPAILFPASREIQLSAGDLLTIRIFGMTDYAPTVRVGQDRAVELPLVGVVTVAGLTVRQAEDLIAARLVSAGMYRNPQVSIQITESPNGVATVTGEMHGIIPVFGGRRLYDVLSASGGLTPLSSHTIVVNRPGLDKPIVVNLGTDAARSAEANIPIFPGDTIVISRVGVVYLLGDFKTQGAIPLQQNAPLTLMKAAALGGGTTFSGKYSDLRIIRTNGVTRSVVRVDIDKVVHGKTPDPVLQADDIVFLPTDWLKSAIQVGGIGALLGLVTLLLYATNN
jgi:polysaccharide export outer membrane protein